MGRSEFAFTVLHVLGIKLRPQIVRLGGLLRGRSGSAWRERVGCCAGARAPRQGLASCPDMTVAPYLAPQRRARLPRSRGPPLWCRHHRHVRSPSCGAHRPLPLRRFVPLMPGGRHVLPVWGRGRPPKRQLHVPGGCCACVQGGAAAVAAPMPPAHASWYHRAQRTALLTPRRCPRRPPAPRPRCSTGTTPQASRPRTSLARSPRPRATWNACASAWANRGAAVPLQDPSSAATMCVPPALASRTARGGGSAPPLASIGRLILASMLALVSVLPS